MTAKSKRFRKVVEWEDLDMNKTYGYTVGMFVLSFIFLICWYIEIFPEADKHFFPIGFMFIALVLCIVLPYIFQIKKKEEYYEEIK